MVSKTISFRVMLLVTAGIIIAIGTILAAANSGFWVERDTTPTLQAKLEVDVFSPNAKFILDRKPYLVQFAPEITPQPIDGEFTLIINNVGNVQAREIYVEFLHYPEENNWYEHRSMKIEQGALQDIGSDLHYQRTLESGDKIIVKYLFTINPELYSEANRNSPTITFNVMYDGNMEVLKQYLVCFDDCVQKRANS